MKKIGLYVHIPFCKSKCIYCDFNSYDSRTNDIDAYIEALTGELELYQTDNKYQYETVFIGGGTPTFINYQLIGVIMQNLRPNITKNAEVSIECNPGTVGIESLRYYKEIGINRLSIGLQACQDMLLKKIGRIHSFKDYVSTFSMARQAGFENINVDLMFSLPAQNIDMWLETLEKIVHMEPEHISCYSLKLEEGTQLNDMYNKGLLTLPEDELDRDMYHTAIKLLEKYNYKQYEISNFSKHGFECRHNLIYWHNQEYLGVGAGSHSKLNDKRYWNYECLDSYINCCKSKKLPIEGTESISKEEEMWESIFLALRLNDGLDIKSFEKRYNIDFAKKYSCTINKLIEKQLICYDTKNMKLTDKGRDLSNQVFMEFM